MELQKNQKAGPIGLINSARNGTKVIDSFNKQIKAILATCGIYVGIENKPDEFVLIILVDFIKDKLKLFTLEEIVLAFKQLAANEYKVELEHYGKLSPAYLKDVMDTYKYWRDKHIGNENRKELHPSGIVENVNYNECYNYIDRYCKENKSIPYGANWSQAYDYAFRENIINPTTEQKAMTRAIAMKSTKVKNEKEFRIACKKEFILMYFENKYGLKRPKIII